ncbi:hypothetical protein V8E53_000888 [Lactarius tabidus]
MRHLDIWFSYSKTYCYSHSFFRGKSPHRQPSHSCLFYGREFEGPGFVHGTFVPFCLMFGEDFRSVSIVKASIEDSFSPESNWDFGMAITNARLKIHNLRNLELCTLCQHTLSSFQRRRASRHLCYRCFRSAHLHEEDFMPLYVSAGAEYECWIECVKVNGSLQFLPSEPDRHWHRGSINGDVTVTTGRHKGY